MTDDEIQLLKQLEQDIRALEKGCKALQNQINAVLQANLITSTALLNFLNCSHPRSAESREVGTALRSLKELKASVDRRLDARRG